VSAIDLLVSIFVVLLGLAFGSFLNVCIARLPRGESIVHPPSHCPRCGAAIRARDNLPLLSYVLLRGRCRACGGGISWRYPAVELANAALWLLCYLAFGETMRAAAMGVLCFLALGLAAMDAETLLLPDAFTLPGIGLGIAWSAVAAGGSWLRGAGLSLLWAASAAGVILLIRFAYWLVRRREGMGMGDAKLFAMLGAWLGPAEAVLILFLAVVAGALYGLVSVRAGGKTPETARVPLGAFLCAAALYAVFLGPRTIGWYLHFF
jgi:leader peptidase (prepilin peptidase)/N-methyltransferase